MIRFKFSLIALLALLLSACQSTAAPTGQGGEMRVLAVESFLADIAQQVAGERLRVETLIPIGTDPHTFEATPRDVARITNAQVLIVNGAGYEEWLQPVLNNAGGERLLVQASAGLEPRQIVDGEHSMDDGHGHEGDPHYWLDPLLVIQYVENIRAGLSQVDPDGQAEYFNNAKIYITQLNELDNWILQQVDQIPLEQRKIVTNHDSFGYYADRYGFVVVGAIIPGVSSGASPSARELARLVDAIRAADAPAVFLETGANQDLAKQLERETGVKVIAGLYIESTSGPGGEAGSYVEMMKFNTRAFVDALR